MMAWIAVVAGLVVAGALAVLSVRAAMIALLIGIGLLPLLAAAQHFGYF